MVFFKKKLTEMEAPSVLAEILKVIITNSAIDPLSIIKNTYLFHYHHYSHHLVRSSSLI